MNTKKIAFASLTSLLVLCGAMVSSQTPTEASRFKEEFLYRINKVRAAGCQCGKKFMPPAPPLVWNDTLERSARNHARDMDLHNYFSHTGRDGKDIEDRIVLNGYKFKGYRSFAVGENIAYGQHSIAEVSDGWFQSPGHCENLMNPAFKEIGVAQSGLYWVQDFGGRIPFSPEELKQMKQSGWEAYRHIKSN